MYRRRRRRMHSRPFVVDSRKYIAYDKTRGEHARVRDVISESILRILMKPV